MKRYFTLLCFAITSFLFGQDVQFSQFYSNPLYLNPAFTGTGECYRAGIQVRSQWVGLKSFNTLNLYADLNYHDKKSGFGVLAVYDQAGTPKLTSNELHGLYSYHVEASEHVQVRFGLQAGFMFRSFNDSGLSFEDQYKGTTIAESSSMDPILQNQNLNKFDASTGILIYEENKYWLGLSLHHLTSPSIGFTDESILPRKLSLHGGWKLNFTPPNGLHSESKHHFDITPAFNYKSQGKHDQLDVGLYFMRDFYLLGAWYRGLFFKSDEGITNSDAISIQGGLKFDKLSFIYSYDIVTSKLGQSNTLGSHEISIQYKFCAAWPPRHKIMKRLPCPTF